MTSTPSPRRSSIPGVLARATLFGVTAVFCVACQNTEVPQQAAPRFTEKFCNDAQHFQLGEGENLKPATKLRYLESMRNTIPEGHELRGPLAVVIASYGEHPPAVADVQAAGTVIGRYIEVTCAGINIGGVR